MDNLDAVLSYCYHNLGRPALARVLMDSPYVLDKSEIQDRANFCLNFGEINSFTISEPQGPDPTPNELRMPDTTIKNLRPCVCELSDVQIIGNSGLTVTTDGKFVLEEMESSSGLTASAILKSIYNRQLPIRRTNQGIRYQHPVAILFEQGTHGYYHWMCEYLPRIRGIEKYAERTSTYPYVLISKEGPTWKQASLRYLNVPDDRIVLSNGKRINADRFVIPLLPRYEFQVENSTRSKLSSPAGAKWVADRMKDHFDIKYSQNERILITRQNAQDRRLENKSAVIEALSEYGFKPYTLDELSLEDQIRLFADAEIVVGPHGAGFTNTIFSDHITMIELIGDHYSDVFYVIGSSLGHNHMYQHCTDVDGDLLVDISDLKDQVECILTESSYPN